MTVRVDACACPCVYACRFHLSDNLAFETRCDRRRSDTSPRT